MDWLLDLWILILAFTIRVFVKNTKSDGIGNNCNEGSTTPFSKKNYGVSAHAIAIKALSGECKQNRFGVQQVSHRDAKNHIRKRPKRIVVNATFMLTYHRKKFEFSSWRISIQWNLHHIYDKWWNLQVCLLLHTSCQNSNWKISCAFKLESRTLELLIRELVIKMFSKNLKKYWHQSHEFPWLHSNFELVWFILSLHHNRQK